MFTSFQNSFNTPDRNPVPVSSHSPLAVIPISPAPNNHSSNFWLYWSIPDITRKRNQMLGPLRPAPHPATVSSEFIHAVAGLSASFLFIADYGHDTFCESIHHPLGTWVALPSGYCDGRCQEHS